MEYRTLGRTGLEVSAISLGTEYLLDVPPVQAVDVVRRAIEAGVNYFDLFYAQPAFRDTMAQAGGRDASKLSDALASVPRLVGQSMRGEI
mgnify:CR=1 FL=1